MSFLKTVPRPMGELTLTEQRAEQLRRNLLPSLTFMVVCLVALFFGLSQYAELGVHTQDEVTQYYVWFIHVAFMVYVGFGLLMTFLRRYSLSAVCFNYLGSALVFLLALLILGAAHQTLGTKQSKIHIDLPLMIEALFCSAAGMIAYGAVIGKATPTQLMWVLLALVPAYAVNQYIVIHQLHILDAGGSNVIHMFGAYYGLAVSWVLSSAKKVSHSQEHPKNSSSYTHDILSMIGTLFLFLYWPSFNGALTSVTHVSTAGHVGGVVPTVSSPVASAQFLSIVNTVISLSGAVVSTFMASVLVGGRVNAVHVQNSTLAGGVAMGAACTLALSPGGALVIGLSAGALSTLGFQYLTPALDKHMGLRDTCGVHNLHGLPGILGSLVAGLAALGMTDNAYYPRDCAGLEPRSCGGYQLGYQLAGICVCVGISVVWGLIVGAIIRFSNPMRESELSMVECFDDGPWWQGETTAPMVEGSVHRSRHVSQHGYSLIDSISRHGGSKHGGSRHNPSKHGAVHGSKHGGLAAVGSQQGKLAATTEANGHVSVEVGHSTNGNPHKEDAFLARHHELARQQQGGAQK